MMGVEPESSLEEYTGIKNQCQKNPSVNLLTKHNFYEGLSSILRRLKTHGWPLCLDDARREDTRASPH